MSEIRPVRSETNINQNTFREVDMSHVLICGSLGIDSIETPQRNIEDVLGGSAVYGSVASSFFSNTYMVAVGGEDFSDRDRGLLEKAGIDLSGLEIVSGGKCFRWRGKYHENMISRETLETQLNVLETFKPRVPESAQKGGFVFLANVHPGVQEATLDQIQSPQFTVCDTMDLWINTARDELDALLPRVDCIMMNDDELKMYADLPTLLQSARKLAEKGPRYVIIKKGEHGSFLFDRDSGGLFICPAFPVEALVDPTGAGDSFAGAFTGFLAAAGDTWRDKLREAIVMGAVTASFTVESFSLDIISRIVREDIDCRARELKSYMRIA